MSFLISILVLLLYAAIALAIIEVIKYFYQRVFGTPIPERFIQLIYTIVALIFTIWFVESLVTHTPIPLPWQMGGRP